MGNLSAYKIESISEGLNRRLILDYLHGDDFAMIHSLRESSTYIMADRSSINAANASGAGFKLIEAEYPEGLEGRFACISVSIFEPKGQDMHPDYAIDRMYGLFSGLNAKVFTCFAKVRIEEVTGLQRQLEERLSNIETRLSQSMNDRESGNAQSKSVDLYHKSYEKRLLSPVLGNINDILLSQGLSYKVLFVLEDCKEAIPILKFIKSNSIALDVQYFHPSNMDEMMDYARRAESVPLSYTNAAYAVGISDKISRANRIRTQENHLKDGIAIGLYLDSGMDLTDKQVHVSEKVLNLGTLVTGLPGTGKTKMSQGMISGALNLHPRVSIVSPTPEWNSFGKSNGLKVLKLGVSSDKINLFKCETDDVVSFYENLAMLVAAGCRAGPYQESMEKCLLAAFSKAYAKTKTPDPQEVYEEIEESLIEQHAKRARNSVRYTKHGENIRAALEDLRQLLMKPQFAYPEGISFKSAIEKGVVFDISGISNNSKALVYSLLLNQIYGICDTFDTLGNDDLRLIICLEEAQLVFNADDESSATIDLKERIQDFRKKGVGIVLITHNVTDISPAIRRLCQNKFYFRQSSDIAKYAAADLIFDESDYDNVVGMLKTLGQRICALNAVSIQNDERIVKGSMFARTNAYVSPDYGYDGNSHTDEPVPDTVINISNPEKWIGKRYQIFYLREKVRESELCTDTITEKGLLQERKYKVMLIAERARDNIEFDIMGGKANSIAIGPAPGD